MQKKLIALAIGATLALGSTQLYAWGLSSISNPLGGSSSGGGDVGTQVANFQTSAGLANGLVANSAVNLLKAVSSQQDAADLQKKLDTINRITDPKEKEAEQSKLVASVQAQLATAQANSKTQADLKNASSDEKSAIAKGLFNLALGLLQVSDLSKSGSGIISGVSKSPTDALKVVPVKDTLPILSSLGTNGKTVLDSGLSLAKGADIKVDLPTSSSEKPLEGNMGPN